MKKLKIAAFLTLLGTGFFGQSAQAQLTYTNGDLFLGFRNTTSTQDLLIDIGQAVYSTSAGQTITIGNFSTDLVNTFGASWFTSGKTKWGSIAGDLSTDPAATLYVGRPESSFGTFPVNPGSTYLRDTTGNQTNTLNNEEAMKNSFVSFDTNTGNGGSDEVTIQNNSDANSYFSWVTQSGGAFLAYNGFEGTITSGATGNNGHAIDLFQIKPDDNTPGTLSPTYEGRFVIDSTGTVTYTAAGSVPEPSTLTALAGGVALLGLVRRRRAVSAA